MKIIEGFLAGKQIHYKEQKGTRVTTDKVRKAVFDVLKGLIENPSTSLGTNSASLEGLNVADLFCGSGMYGIEALSRGAGSCVFVDDDKSIIHQLRKNLSKLKVESLPSQTAQSANSGKPELFDGVNKVESKSYEKFIKTCDEKFDLIFADPPYYNFDFEKLNTVHQILNKGGIFVLEQSKRGGIKELNGLELFLEKKYGDTRVLFFRKI